MKAGFYKPPPPERVAGFPLPPSGATDPLGACPLRAVTRVPLTHFVPKDLAELTDPDDIAAIGRLLASTERTRANAAFLASLVPHECPPPGEEDLEEMRSLAQTAKGSSTVAALTPQLAAAALADVPTSDDVAEANALLNQAKRPRVRAIVQQVAARLAAADARATASPPDATGGLATLDLTEVKAETPAAEPTAAAARARRRMCSPSRCRPSTPPSSSSPSPAP